MRGLLFLMLLLSSCNSIINLDKGIPKLDEAGRSCFETGLRTCSIIQPDVSLVCNDDLVWENVFCPERWTCDIVSTSDTFGECILVH